MLNASETRYVPANGISWMPRRSYPVLLEASGEIPLIELSELDWNADLQEHVRSFGDTFVANCTRVDEPSVIAVLKVGLEILSNYRLRSSRFSKVSAPIGNGIQLCDNDLALLCKGVGGRPSLCQISEPWFEKHQEPRTDPCTLIRFGKNALYRLQQRVLDSLSDKGWLDAESNKYSSIPTTGPLRMPTVFGH